MNLNYLFNKEFYNCLATPSLNPNEYFERMVIKLRSTRFSEEMHTAAAGSRPKNSVSFCMKTVYPGLLIGIGNPHGAGAGALPERKDNESGDEDIKTGFSFDYVSGMPYIPGSSVKGVIKSAFRHPELIRDLMDRPDMDDAHVTDIMKDIFENGSEYISEAYGAKVIKRDIFLDAVVVKGDDNGLFIGTDYVTSHADPLQNPNPVQMLKLLPDVVLEFRFILNDSAKIGLSAEDKLGLFKKILEFTGVGAKTNTGYGILELCKDIHSYKNPEDLSEKKKLLLGIHEFNENSNSGSNTTVGQNSRNARNRTACNRGTAGTQNNRGNQNGNSGNFRSLKCPNCGYINFRYNREGTRENYDWKQGICHQCKRSINTGGVS